MRRTITFTMLALLAVFMIVSCQGPHAHTFGDEWKYDNDNHWHAATCEHSDEVIDKAPHDFEEEVTKAPSAAEDGEKTLTCKVCGFQTTEVIPHKHTYSEEWTKDAEHHWHAATCGHSDEVIDKAAHTYDDGTVKTAPGYGTTGLTTYTCKICGYSYDKVTDALGAKDNTVSYTGTLSKDYDGNALTLDDTKITRNGDGAISFMYKKSSEDDSAYTGTAPEDAGEYSVKISVASTAEWKAAETVVTYTINRIALTLTELEMTYEVLPDAEGTTGIDSYKSKTFTDEDGLPEGVTVTVYPYNEVENGTFTVGSSGEGTYVIKGLNSKEALLLALQSSNTTLKDVLVAYVDPGSNYTLPEDGEVAILTVKPKKLTVSGTLAAAKEYDEEKEIIVSDLSSVSGADGISLSDYAYVITMESADYGASVDEDTIGYLKKKESGEASYNFYIDTEDINASIEKRKITIPYYIPTPMYAQPSAGDPDPGYRWIESGYKDSADTVKKVRVRITPQAGSFTADSILAISLTDLYCENDNYTFELTQALKTSDTSRFKIYKYYGHTDYQVITDGFSQVFMASSPTGTAVKEASYRFTASTGEKYRITYTDNPLFIGLWDKDGNSYYLDYTVAEGSANFTVPAAGTYYIICLASTEASPWQVNNRIDKTSTATFKFSKITTE